MADPDIDWRSYERWRVPNVEEVLFPFWFNETVSEDAYISQIERPHEKEKQLQLLNEKALRKLNALIHSDDVVLFARIADPRNDIEIISLSHFHSVHSWSFQRRNFHNKSMIQLAAGESITTYYDVHIFPLIVAPGYQKHLTGKVGPLVDKFVLNDRELTNKTPLTDIGLATWLEVEASAFLVRLSDDPEIVGQGVFEGLGHSRIRPFHRQSVGKVLVDRLVRLFGVMLSAEVSIAGRPWPDGPLQLLPLTHLDLAGYSFCLATKRLMLNKAPAWSDVRLLRPGSPLAASLPQATIIGADQGSAQGDPAQSLPAAGDDRGSAVDTGHSRALEVQQYDRLRRDPGGREKTPARMAAMYAIIAEYNRIQKPLFDTYDALAADLLRRQWAIEKAQEESKYPGANSTEIKSTTNWVRENFPDLRQPLIRTK